MAFWFTVALIIQARYLSEHCRCALAVVSARSINTVNLCGENKYLRVWYNGGD